MSSESPDVVLYDSSSNALAVQNATALPASTPALMIAGSDGYVSRYVAVDSVGKLIIVGAVTLPKSTSTATNSVSASASNVTLLSSNSSRLGATIWNDSTTATLYVKLGTTASTSDYTAQLYPSGYYELPYNYSGRVDGIWTAAVGSAKVTELA